MAYITYTAKREIEPTGFSKTGTDFSAIASDDSFNAVSTNLSGLLTDQWLQAAGFVKNAGWFQVKSNSTSAKILTLTPPVTHLRLPGVSGNDATTPDSAAVSITGDIDLRAKIAPTDWTNGTGTQEIIAKSATDSSQFSYLLRLNSDGTLSLYWSSDGSAMLNGTSTVATGFVDGTTHWIRATLDVNNGAAGRDIRFYTSDDGVIWTQLGATVTQGTATSIFDGTASLRVGMRNTASNGVFTGRIYYAEIRTGFDGTGTVVAAFDPTRGTRGTGSLVALTGETWTINTSGTPPALLQGPLLTYEGAEYLSLPGVAGNYASTPDSAAVSITGDIDIRARVSSNDWTPAAVKDFTGKFVTSGNQRAYMLRLEAAGTLQIIWSADGTATISKSSTVATSFADGSAHWVRVILDVNNGAAGNDVKFYTSEDYDPATGLGIWTQLGATVTTGGTTSIFDSTATLEVGTTNSGTSGPTDGKIYYAEVRNGIGGPVVAAFDPGRAAAGAASLTSYTGEVWTINTSGSPAAALVRVTPVTITGYKRGYGQSYSIEFKAEQVDRKVKVKRSTSQPIGGGAPETLLDRQEATIDVLTEVLSEASQVPQFREFLASASAGEVFTFDRYGTIAVPVDPRQAILESADYAEQRVMATLQQRIQFTARLLT